MHYKNGREAKNGDKVICVQTWKGPNGETLGATTVGILYDAQVGNDHCNGRLAPISSSDSCPDLKSCLHLDDALALLDAPVLKKTEEPVPEPKPTAPF